MEAFHKLDPEDELLISAAAEVLQKNFHPVRHSVGAAVLCGSGKIYTGINIEACGYGPCAEPIALGAALSNGERQITSIVAVTKNDADAPCLVLSPCGNCRQLLLDYAPEATIIFKSDNNLVKANVRLLLPGAYQSCFE